MSEETYLNNAELVYATHHNGVCYLEHLYGEHQFTLLANAADLSKNDKPIYLSLVMDIEQLNSIIKNGHLFDKSLVNTAYLLLSQYKLTEIKYSE